MNHSKWMRASAVMAAGFAAGVLAVIACDGGPDAAGAQGECGTCTVSGPIALAGPVQVAGPIAVQPRQCAQWEMRQQRLAALNPTIIEGADSYLATANAPENWEPISPTTGTWTDAILFKRCARWE